jgi:hypothetical protein
MASRPRNTRLKHQSMHLLPNPDSQAGLRNLKLHVLDDAVSKS